jgi:NTP pyrophosphatase (non-canonical NTP hydrolase)
MVFDCVFRNLGLENAEKLDEEIQAARMKFPKNRRLTLALMEELGELARAELQGKPRSEIQKEALQVACLAMRIYSETDADFDNLTPEEMKP